MDIKEIRQQFPVVDDYIYFDLANKCPLPAYNVKKGNEYLLKQSLTGGNKQGWYEIVKETRENFAKFINASENEICFTKNTSEGLNIAARCLPLKKGDTVLLNYNEHPNNVYCWLNLEKEGINIKFLPEINEGITVKDIEAAIDDTTKVISISSVTYAPGNRNDIEGISKLCKEKGIYTVIDAVQSFGTLNVDVKKWDVDIICTSAHKALLSPHGLGVLYCNKRILDTIQPLYVARAGMDMASQIENKEIIYELKTTNTASKFEIGNYNYLGLSLFNESIKFLLDLGMDNVEKHIMEINEYFIDGLVKLGLEIKGPSSGPMRSAIICFKIGPVDEAYDYLVAHRVLTTKRRGMIRVAIGPYSTKEDVDQFISILGDFIDSYNLKIKETCESVFS